MTPELFLQWIGAILTANRSITDVDQREILQLVVLTVSLFTFALVSFGLFRIIYGLGDILKACADKLQGVEMVKYLADTDLKIEETKTRRRMATIAAKERQREIKKQEQENGINISNRQNVPGIPES